jgi:hypothetical protein
VEQVRSCCLRLDVVVVVVVVVVSIALVVGRKKNVLLPPSLFVLRCLELRVLLLVAARLSREEGRRREKLSGSRFIAAPWNDLSEEICGG